ncbi:hypothetical protein [Bradyrhizobium sp. USDA 4486]
MRSAADNTLLGPVTEAARVAIGNVIKTSERFGDCEWLTAADADGFLDKSTLQVQRTGAGSCMMFDREANTMTVAVIATSGDTAIGMMKRPVPASTWRSPSSAVKRSASIPAPGQRQRRQHLCLEERRAGFDPVRAGQAAFGVQFGRAPEGGRGTSLRKTLALHRVKLPAQASVAQQRPRRRTRQYRRECPKETLRYVVSSRGERNVFAVFRTRLT